MTTRALLPLVLALGLALLGGGCGRDEPAAPDPGSPPAWPSAEERTLRPDHAPTPFTAAQIREGCPSGRRATFRIESAEQGPGFLVLAFADADAEGVQFTVTRLDEARRPVGEAHTARSTWEQLQTHASFDAGRTEIRDTVVDVPAGSFACITYEVRAPAGEAGSVTRYDFARDLPGMPIRVVETRDGRVVSRQELLENEPGATR